MIYQTWLNGHPPPPSKSSKLFQWLSRKSLQLSIKMHFCWPFNIELKHLTSMVTDNKETPDCCISWIKETCFPLGVVMSPGCSLPTGGQCPGALSGVCSWGRSHWSLSHSWSTCLVYPGCFHEFWRNVIFLMHLSCHPGLLGAELLLCGDCPPSWEARWDERWGGSSGRL